MNSMQDLNEILSRFPAITLKEMDQVALMDRIDTKFVFHVSQLPDVLLALMPEYHVLKVRNTIENRYCNLYFDTEDMLFYRLHHNRHMNRYKVRYRSYLDSGQSFFEIKFKNNHARTIKERISRMMVEESISGEAESFMRARPALSELTLLPRLWINYKRITLVNLAKRERLTIDTHLSYTNGTQTAAYPSLVIAELKIQKSAASPFLILMKQLHIRRLSVSKYILGIISLYDDVKTNNFRSKIRRIQKISHEHN